MRILFAADGSSFTKKALAFIVTHPNLLADCELLVLHVQPALPPRVASFVGAKCVHDYHAEEAAHVLEPIAAFLRQHALEFESGWVVGQPAEEILGAAIRDRAHMIVMGTHGHGLLGRVLLGSVAQGVVSGAEVPVLLVK